MVWRLDRSMRDLLQIVDGLDRSGINFISLMEKFDTSTAAGRLVFHFFAALAQFGKGANQGVHHDRVVICPGARADGRP